MNAKLTKINTFSTLPLITSPTNKPTLMKRKSEADLNNSNDKEMLSSSSKSTRTGELTYNGKAISLFEAKKARVQIERDSQLLANRILLLQNEQLRVSKKIEETRKKAKELLKTKNENELNYINKMKRRESNLDMEKNNRETNNMIRNKRQTNIHEKKYKMYEDKVVEAINIKKTTKALESKKTEIKTGIIKENERKKISVKTQQRLSTEKLTFFKEKKIEETKKDYMKRIKEEQDLIEKKAKELLRLEQLESELLRNLQNTQIAEASAYSELESAMKTISTPVKDRIPPLV